jgi:pimeloyl-ACP methyl ester carboxylesterase
MSTSLPPPLGYYERGATTYFASRVDQRFGYYLYVPPHFTLEDAQRFDLCVLVHGTGRTPSVYRDLFRDFADANDAIVLAPLFPASINRPGELSNYKFIAFEGIRYDHVLLAMVDEVRARYALTPRPFALFGFSGGAHFAHRFAYLHPDQLLAVSIGAPGMVTLLDPSLPWWRGTQDLEQRFGRTVDLDALRRVQVQMVVGAQDVETWEITIQPDSPFWMEGANAAGVTRIDRLRTLERNFNNNGIAVRFDLVEGIAHNGYAVLAPVQAFFADVLCAARGRA